jgi:protein-S-isoprenylcysteine O-methyltransferase Ste14
MISIVKEEMKMRLNLDPTKGKVIFIAALLFLEAIAIPTYTVTQQSRFPTLIEMTGFVLSAFVQLCTFLLTFLQTGEIPETVKKESEEDSS